MKTTFLIFALVFTSSVFAQDFQFGVQGGTNFSFSFVEGEGLEGGINYGYSLGVSGRYDTGKKMKIKWARFKMKHTLLLESGLQIVGQGISYKYADFPIRHHYQRLELPVLLVIKGDNRYAKKLRKKNWHSLAKVGLVFSTQLEKEITSSHSWGTDYFIEERLTRSNGINPNFSGGVGYQKEYPDKSILYIGYSWIVSFKTIIRGNMFYWNNNSVSQGILSKRGDYFSINIQYFYGIKEDERTIYNPRF